MFNNTLLVRTRALFFNVWNLPVIIVGMATINIKPTLYVSALRIGPYYFSYTEIINPRFCFQRLESARSRRVHGNYLSGVFIFGAKNRPIIFVCGTYKFTFCFSTRR